MTVFHAHQIAQGETYLSSIPSTIALRHEYLCRLGKRITIHAAEARNGHGGDLQRKGVKRARSPEQDALEEPDPKHSRTDKALDALESADPQKKCTDNALDPVEPVAPEQAPGKDHQLVAWKKPLNGAASKESWDDQYRLLLSFEKQFRNRVLSIDKERADELLKPGSLHGKRTCPRSYR